MLVVYSCAAMSRSMSDGGRSLILWDIEWVGWKWANSGNLRLPVIPHLEGAVGIMGPVPRNPQSQESRGVRGFQLHAYEHLQEQ